MFDLIISEFKRYQNLAYIVAISQILLWIFMSQLFPTMAPHSLKQLLLLSIATIGGITFGLVTTYLHKRKNHWTYLIHRPIATSTIHICIVIAHLCLLFIGLCFPTLVVFLGVDIATNNIVELRHYLSVVHLFAIAVSSYFIASYAVLSPAKASFLSLWFMIYLVTNSSSALLQTFIIDLVFVLVTFFLAHRCFRVNTSTLFSNKAFLVVSVIALQPALLLILMMLNIGYYHVPLALTGNHPNKNEQLSSYKNYLSLEKSKAFKELLEKSDHENASDLARQVEFSEYKFVRRSVFSTPSENKLFIHERKNRFQLPQPNSTNQWVYSHQKRVFVGRDSLTDEPKGYLTKIGFLGLNESLSNIHAFEHTAVPVDNRFIQTENTIFHIDFDNKKVKVKHALPNDEYYTKTVKFLFERAVLQSNKSTYIFDEIDFVTSNNTIEPEHIIAHPSSLPYFDDVSITEMLDGFLLRYSDAHFLGYQQPGAALVYVNHDEGSTLLVNHHFDQPHTPDFIAYQPFILSPIFMNLVNGFVPNGLKMMGEPYHPYLFFWQRDFPQSVLIFCLAFALLSVVGAYIIANKMQWTISTKITVITLVAVLSLPGLLALFVLCFATLRQKQSLDTQVQSVAQQENAHV